jgi:AbiV family abortive infection protein
MSTEIVPFDATLLRAMNACTDHARDLLASAYLVQQAGHSNIAFHLAVLALEELGRRELLGVKTVVQSGTLADKYFQDHIQKLFWCFFGARLTEERITTEALDAMKGFATRLHSQRLAGLYVDVGTNGLSIPAEQVPKDEAERILSLAEARLALADASSLREGRTKEEMATQAWFLSTTQDPERRKLVFSGKSLDKLAELGSAKAWVDWLKTEFDRAEEENRALAEAELERGRHLVGGVTRGSVTKWRVRIRLYTNSHSVRQKPLNYWNERVTWIKLTAVPDKKDQLILELQLGDQVPVQDLWHFAWGVARSFVAALNIATMGFWFWRVPTQVSRFYVSIDDVVNKCNVVLDRQPPLKPDWGENRVLTTQDLENTISTFVCMPGQVDTSRHEPYNYYLGGLTFLSLNDLHWQCEASILGNFLSSHRAMMQSLGELPESKPFSTAMGEFLAASFPELDEDRARILALCVAFEEDRLQSEAITLKDATFGKLFCDAYFLHRIRPRELARRKANQVAAGDVDERASH